MRAATAGEVGPFPAGPREIPVTRQDSHPSFGSNSAYTTLSCTLLWHLTSVDVETLPSDRHNITKYSPAHDLPYYLPSQTWLMIPRKRGNSYIPPDPLDISLGFSFLETPCSIQHSRLHACNMWLGLGQQILEQICSMKLSG